MIDNNQGDKSGDKQKNIFNIGFGQQPTETEFDSDSHLDQENEHEEEEVWETEEEEQAKENSVEEQPDNVVKFVRHSKKPIVIVCIVLLLIGGVGLYFYMNRTFESYMVDSSFDRADGTAMQYLSFYGGFVKYNSGGITYEDRDGHIVWTEAFTMTAPKVIVKGQYVAITDIGGNQYTLYNSSRKIITVTTDYPITDIQVANQGLVAVTLENQKINYIVAFNSEGEKCVEIKTTIDKNGYPMSIALSDNGQKLVAACVTVEGTKLSSALTFYNFGNVGKNEVDRQVGYKKFENEVFPSMEFLDNNTLCAFGDTRMLMYAMKQKPKQICSHKYEENVKSVFYNEKYAGYVYKNVEKEDTSNSNQGTKKSSKQDAESKEEPAKYILRAFNLSGKEVLTQDVRFDYTSLHSTKDEIVLLSGNHCEIYKYNGFTKYCSEFENGISEMFPTDRKNHYVLMTGNKTKMIHLK